MDTVSIVLGLISGLSFVGLLRAMFRCQELTYPDVLFVVSAGSLMVALGGLLILHGEVATGYAVLVVAALWFGIYAGPVVAKLKKIERGEKV